MARKPKSALTNDEFPIPNFKAARDAKVPVDVEAQKTRLKSLIKLGKERGFLTYAEINDHLPDDSPRPRRSKASSARSTTWVWRCTSRRPTPKRCC